MCGGTRTYHRMACAIEDAGFEIRDQIQWIYGSGFPKILVDHFTHGSHNFGENEVIYYMRDINLSSFRKYIENNNDFIQFVAIIAINHMDAKWIVIKSEETNAPA